MYWGAIGLTLGCGAWLAANAFPQGRARSALRGLGVGAALAPIALRFAGWI
jgi:hypothetical protein